MEVQGCLPSPKGKPQEMQDEAIIPQPPSTDHILSLLSGLTGTQLIKTYLAISLGTSLPAVSQKQEAQRESLLI